MNGKRHITHRDNHDYFNGYLEGLATYGFIEIVRNIKNISINSNGDTVGFMELKNKVLAVMKDGNEWAVDRHSKHNRELK